MGLGLEGRGGELDVATLVWPISLFVGPMDGSIGSFGRCRVSSSERIMLPGKLQTCIGRELEMEIWRWY